MGGPVKGNIICKVQNTSEIHEEEENDIGNIDEGCL